MQQHELRPPKGATHKRKRIGRGNASGHGTYSTKGMKGQKARAGGGVRPSFEGGQLPFVRRMAYKRGFHNPFRVDYEEVNVGDLASLGAGAEVTPETLRGARILRTKRPVKVLGNGDITVALTVEADRFSKSAREKIEAAGGTVRWVNGEPPPREPKQRKAPAKSEAKVAEKSEGKQAKAEKAPKGAKADAGAPADAPAGVPADEETQEPSGPEAEEEA
jgi:large subunit ribosomal protein L15